MNRDRAMPLDSGWRRILDLGETLMRLPAGAGHHDLILETAAALCGADAVLWLADDDGGGETPAESAPPTALMRTALAQGGLLTAPPDGEVCVPFGGGGTGQAAAVPLIGRQAALGVLQVTRPDGPPFTAVELDLLRGLGIQCAIALDAARQVAIERWRIDQLTLVRQVSAQVAGVLDLDELLCRVADLILSTFGYYYVALFTVETNPPAVRFRASAGPDPSAGPPAGSGRARQTVAVHVRPGAGIIGWVAAHGEEIVANAVCREPRYRRATALPETKSETALPLRMGDRVLGVLDVQSDHEDDFDETDVLVLRALADTIAAAVEGRRLYDDVRRRAEQLAAVAQVSRAVVSILDQDRLLHAVAALIHQRFGFPYVHLFTVDAADGRIVYRAGSGPRSAGFESHEVSYAPTDEPGIIPWAVRQRETVLVNDVEHDARYRPSPLPPAETRSELAVPLVFGGRVLGVLDVQSDRAGAFSADDRFLFEALADAVALALRNADLYHAEQWQRRTEAYAAGAALQVAQAVARLNDLDAILDYVVHAVPDLAGALRCLVFLEESDGTGYRLAAGSGLPPETRAQVLGRPYTEADFPLLYSVRRCDDLTACVAEARPCGSGPVRAPADVQALFEPPVGGVTRRIVALPLAVQTDLFGVLVVQQGAAAQEEAGAKWLEILADIAQQAALAIQNCRYREQVDEREHLDRELAVARAIQQTFMPREMPGLRGWDLAMAWQPARQVSGDFYDFFDLPDGRLGLVIADVADKGIPAALFMALTRTLVRAAAALHASPAAALAYANRLMVPDAHRGMFVTAVYGVVALDTGRLVYANAGHMLPLVWRLAGGAGAVELAGRGGIALGVLEHASYVDREVDLRPGDCLILYTDGITDAVSPSGEMYGLERLRGLVSGSRWESACGLSAAIEAAVSAFSARAAPADDLTMAVLHRQLRPADG